MPRTSTNRSYFVINLVFALIILLIFLYSALHNAENSNYPIISSIQLLSGETTISSGLSRSFSELIRFRFSSARSYNPHGLRIFIYFVVQFVLRISFLIQIIRKMFVHSRILIITDSVQAVVLFLFCFWPFLDYLFNSIKAPAIL